MATRKRQSTKSSRKVSRESAAGVTSSTPTLQVQTTPSKATARTKSRRAQSPAGVDQLISPEATRKCNESCDGKLDYSKHSSSPLEPGSQAVFEYFGDQATPTELLRKRVLWTSTPSATTLTSSPPASQQSLDVGATTDDASDDELVEFRRADPGEYEHGHESNVVTSYRAIPQAVLDTCIKTFWASIGELKKHKRGRQKIYRGVMYAGFVFYGAFRDGKFVASDERFPPGTVVFLDTDQLNPSDTSTREPGIVHPHVFKKLFDLEEYPSDLVAEAFAVGPPGAFSRPIHDNAAIFNGASGDILCENFEIRYNSSLNSCNARGRSRPCRDERREMNATMQELLREFLSKYIVDSLPPATLEATKYKPKKSSKPSPIEENLAATPGAHPEHPEAETKNTEP